MPDMRNLNGNISTKWNVEQPENDRDAMKLTTKLFHATLDRSLPFLFPLNFRATILGHQMMLLKHIFIRIGET